MPRPRIWTDDQLRSAVGEAKSWKDVCNALGIPVGGKTFKSLRDRADALGLNIEHLYGRGHRKLIASAVSDESLRKLVPECHSWNHLAKQLGYANGWGRCQAHLSSRVERLGLSVKHFRGRGFNGLTHFANDPTFTAQPDPHRLRFAATGRAIAWFSERGYVVSLPVEPAVYDLIVDSPLGLERIQVKSSTAPTRTVRFSRTVYDNRRPGTRSSGHIRQVPYEPGQIDYFFVVLVDGSMYLIPYEVIGRRKSAALGERYREFKV